ncbi:MAG: Asp-tRNA(Asn)/Glu-tRNA(Gln) amidotransferase subunit GatC [Xanthomonadales bacterium]|nr:Asp-tRNA(Asn)/Glu-tRNA(Gln) amidotransferase subunit GatC [Xanthomonadales bacterium]
MEQIDREDVAHVARLARLAASDEELDGYLEHFRRLAEFVEDVTDSPIEDVEPMAHPRDLYQRQRPDEVTEPDGREDFLAVAPQTDDGYFLVPKVIE